MPKKIYNITTRLKSEIVINYNLEDKFSNAAAHITSSHDSLTDPIGYAKNMQKISLLRTLYEHIEYMENNSAQNYNYSLKQIRN